MAKSNPTLRTLSQIFDRSESLIYLVSDECEVLAGNQATADWVGVPVEQLKAAKLEYASAPSAQPAMPWHGLCPPPGLLQAGADLHEAFWVFRKPDSSSSLEFCQACAIRINSQSGMNGILVVADAGSTVAQLPEAEYQGRAPAAQLHALLARVREEIKPRFAIESLVGQSPFAQRLRRQVDIASRSRGDVLMYGPVGCGKEHLARAIHQSIESHSEAQGRPVALAPIHCPIADPQLIQQRIAEARQAADNDRDQLLVLLLLDVDKLPVDAQAELLGFLELPGMQIQSLATSEVPLLELAQQGAFSSQLAYRIGSLAIELLPLKHRREDIPLLAQALLERDNGSREKQLAGFSDPALQLLVEYDWPENMNQLLEVVQQAAARAGGRTIDIDDLPESFRQAIRAFRIGQPTRISIDLNQYLASIEKELIDRAMRNCQGNKTQAARDLNISRPKLLRRLEQLGLEQYLQKVADKDSDQVDSSAFEELIE